MLEYLNKDKDLFMLNNKTNIHDALLGEMVYHANGFLNHTVNLNKYKPLNVHIKYSQTRWAGHYNIHTNKIKINIPKNNVVSKFYDNIKISSNVFDILLHELCHAIDYNDGNLKANTKYAKHDNRPCEIQVYNRLYYLGIKEHNHWYSPFYKQVNFGETISDLIINVAICFDNIHLYG